MNNHLIVIELADRLVEALEPDGFTVELTKDYNKLRKGVKVPVYAPILKTQIQPSQSDLVIQLIVTSEGWSVTPRLTASTSPDFGANIDPAANPEDLCNLIQKTVLAIRKSSVALVVHAQEGRDIVCQIYEKKEDSYELICVCFTYDFSVPVLSNDSALTMDLECDQVKLYLINPSSVGLEDEARAHFISINTIQTCAPRRRYESSKKLNLLNNL